MSCELSPVPTSLSNDSGDLRISKSKSVLKNHTCVKHTARHAAKDAICTAIDCSDFRVFPTGHHLVILAAHCPGLCEKM